jgi:hypothetical protein
MAAVATKIVNFDTQHLIPKFVACYKATDSDWIVTTEMTPACKGMLPIAGWTFSATAAKNCYELTFGLGLIDRVEDDYTATTVSIAVDGINPTITRSAPYYILAQDATATSFEIMEVTADSLPTAAATVLTVKRGCLGTTAGTSANLLKNNAYVYFLNVITLEDSTIGTQLIYGVPLPSESKANLFGTSKR